ncbi:c-type cytochrome [Phaeobacter sp. C3_T13_0]|uniref:c-type cytochrome n=1 Tax=Phaeobacter cretensis TaxID=3342641 RepID=UPI0039BD65A6
MKLLTAVAALGLIAAPAFAEGDPDKGEKGFKKCKSCHMVASDSGDIIIKGGKTGPNLWGVTGRTAGTYDGYKYGKDMVAAGEQGLVWDAESFTAYTADPKGFLREYLDNPKAKSKMSFRLKKGAEDIYAFLAMHGPADAVEDEAEATTEETKSN